MHRGSDDGAVDPDHSDYDNHSHDGDEYGSGTRRISLGRVHLQLRAWLAEETDSRRDGNGKRRRRDHRLALGLDEMSLAEVRALVHRYQRHCRRQKLRGVTTLPAAVTSQALSARQLWTPYRWQHAQHATADDVLAIGTALDTTETLTHDNIDGRGGAGGGATTAQPTTATTPPPRIHGPAVVPVRDARRDPLEEVERQHVERLLVRRQQKEYAGKHAVALDELVPRAAPGREAQQERKALDRQKRREIAGSKDDAATGDVLSDADLFGGGGGKAGHSDSYDAMLAHRERRRLEREEQMADVQRQRDETRQRHSAKEAATMAMFRQIAAARFSADTAPTSGPPDSHGP